MNAKEFRIGNLLGYLEVDLDSGSEIIKNYPCTLNDISEIERGNVCNRYSKVILNDWLLVSFGFTKDTIFGVNVKYSLNGIDIWHNTTNGTLLVDNVKTKLVYLNYAHQLQNIFFALTGVELQLSST